MLFVFCFHRIFVVVVALSSITIATNHHNRKLSATETKLIMEPLEKAKSTLNNLLVLLYQRYEYFDSVTENFMLTTANLNRETWDLAKYKFASKFIKSQISLLTTGGASTSVTSTSSHNTIRDVDSYEEVDISTRFLMIFSGSSVTAGHDNYFNQSFPMIVKKHFQPIFDSLGIKLVVRNIAQGMQIFLCPSLVFVRVEVYCMCTLSKLKCAFCMIVCVHAPVDVHVSVVKISTHLRNLFECTLFKCLTPCVAFSHCI